MNDDSISQNVSVDLGNIALEGDLTTPEQAIGLVIFAHGSGSSRLSPRNRTVADSLNRAGLATLLFDLLTAEEEKEDRLTAQWRFDIALLGQRMADTVRWADDFGPTEHLPMGLFGASTGAAAALVAAAENPKAVQAVVSRGGRPDLAGPALARVHAPTLLIVGGEDHQVIDLNREAARQINCYHQLEIVEGATHLFEEPGKLDIVQRLAADWFTSYLP